MYHYKLDKEKEQYFRESSKDLELLSMTIKEKPQFIRAEENLLLMPLQYKYIYNLITGDFENVEGVDRILGYENNQFTLEFYYKILHPDDREITFEMTRKGIYWADHNRNANKNELQMNVLQRIKCADHEYKYVFRQSVVTGVLGNRIIRTMSVCTDVTAMGIKAMRPAFLAVDKNLLFNHAKVYDYLSEKYYRLLTQREIEVIYWVIEGYTSLDIAVKLHLSKHTIDTHRRNIKKKTGLKTISELKDLFYTKSS